MLTAISLNGFNVLLNIRPSVVTLIYYDLFSLQLKAEVELCVQQKAQLEKERDEALRLVRFQKHYPSSLIQLPDVCVTVERTSEGV